MKAYIQRFDQQQIARFLTLALIPAVLAGTLGLVASYFIMTPVYAAGLYIYLGYRSIGWKVTTNKKAKRTWTWSMIYNGLLFFAAIYFFIVSGIHLRDIWSSIGTIVYASCVGMVSLTSYYTRQTVSDTKTFDSMISEIGTA